MARRRRRAEAIQQPDLSRQTSVSWDRWLWLVIVACALGAYATSFQGAFLFDEDRHILQNESIRSLWPLGPVWSASRRPLVNLSLAINYAVGGLDVWGYHAFNLCVHTLAGLVLFGVVRRTLARSPWDGIVGASGPWLAASTAMIWVVHPLNTQSVTYIIQRGESMMGLFYLLTLYCSIRGADAERRAVRVAWCGTSVVACLAGMVCKPVMVTAPVVIVLYDLFFLSSSPGKLLKRRGVFYLLLCLTWIMMFVLGVVGSTFNTSDRPGVTVGFGFKGISVVDYALTQPWAIVQYLKLSVWPAALCLDYGWPVAQSAGMIVTPIVLLLCVVGGAAWFARRHRWVAFLVAWFFLILAPTSSFIPIRDTIFEHRMYLSLAAVVCGAVIGTWHLLRTWTGRGVLSVGAARVVGVGLLAICVSGLMVRTARRNQDYRDPMVMWQDVAAKRPRNARAYDSIGTLFDARGELVKAEKAFRNALTVKPDYANARYNLGSVLVKMGRFDEGLEAYRKTSELDPYHPYARISLADALARSGRIDEGIAEFRSIIEVEPGNAMAHHFLGNALAQRGDNAGAMECYETSVGLDPDDAIALYDYGNALTRAGRFDEAIRSYRESLRVTAHNPSTHYNLAMALLRSGDRESAVASFQDAVRLNPRHLNARYSLATTLAELGRHSEAIAALREMLRMSPREVRTYYSLGQSLVELGQLDEAVEAYRTALQWAPGDPVIDRALREALRRR